MDHSICHGCGALDTARWDPERKRPTCTKCTGDLFVWVNKWDMAHLQSAGAVESEPARGG